MHFKVSLAFCPNIPKPVVGAFRLWRMQTLWSLEAFRSINRRGRYFSLLCMPDITRGIKRAEVVRTMLLLKFLLKALRFFAFNVRPPYF